MRSDGSDATSVELTAVSDHKVLSEPHQNAREGPSEPAGAIAEREVVLWPLANGRGVTKISLSDLDAVAKHVWSAVQIANHCYAYTTIDKRRLYLHRLLCNGFNDEDPTKTCVDHIDRDCLNNTRENLRRATPSENQANSIGRPKARRSRYKGVAFRKEAKSRPWRALITVHGRLIHLGAFASEEEAAERYNQAALKYFGEFARLNNIVLEGCTEPT